MPESTLGPEFEMAAVFSGSGELERGDSVGVEVPGVWMGVWINSSGARS